MQTQTAHITGRSLARGERARTHGSSATVGAARHGAAHSGSVRFLVAVVGASVRCGAAQQQPPQPQQHTNPINSGRVVCRFAGLLLTRSRAGARARARLEDGATACSLLCFRAHRRADRLIKHGLQTVLSQRRTLHITDSADLLLTRLRGFVRDHRQSL